MGKKKSTATEIETPYVQKNLEFLCQKLGYLRRRREGGITPFRVNQNCLENVIKDFPDEDRENIEKFWGLKGGINHARRIGDSGDISFWTMRNDAIASIQLLFKLDSVFQYDEHLKARVDFLIKKINKNGVQVSNLDAIKYLIMFLLVLQNGPKLSDEEEHPVSANTEDYTFDEYAVIEMAYKEFKNIPDKSINLRLIKSMLEMLDYQDCLAIQKSFEIPIPEESIPNGYKYDEIEKILTLGQMRNFKERVFSYGSWEVTTALIFGNTNGAIKLDGFEKSIDEVRKDWSQIAKFKTGQKKLKTSRELRILDVYTIGGLEFTDIYEVMFLYLERNYINPESR